MPSLPPPGRAKTSLKNWTALRFCHILPTVLTVLHEIMQHFLKGRRFDSFDEVYRKRVKNSLIQNRLNGTLTRSESLQSDGRKSLENNGLYFEE